MRTILLATTILLPLAAQAQTVVLPPVPQPQSSADVAGLLMETDASSAVKSQYRTLGMVFRSGTVPAGSHMRMRVLGGRWLVPAQMDERTHWPDGSVRTAALSFQTPAYRAQLRKAAYMISTGGSAPGAAVSLAGFTPGVATVDVTIGSAGHHFDVAQLLAAGAPAYWLHGPQATEARVDAPVPGAPAMHVTIDARAYADGSSQLDVTFANDLAFAAGGPVSYTAAIKLGTQGFTQKISNQQPFTDWHHVVYSSGAPPAGNFVHDIPMLEATGMVPHYPLSAGVAQATLNAEVAPNSCAPLSPCGITPYMPTTGGREDIGVVPEWDMFWLQTQTAQSAAYALEQADVAAGAVPWHVEQSGGVPVSVLQHNVFWADDRCAGSSGAGNCSPMSFGNAVNGSGNGVPITPDTAHQPGLSYVAYLLTGSHHYLDELVAQAGFSESSAWTGVRNWTGYPLNDPKASALVCGVNQQLRACAWSLRELFMAALVAPDGSAAQSYFQQVLQTNLGWAAQDAAAPAKGAVGGWLDGFYGGGEPQFAPWQNDFAALVLEWATHANVAHANSALAAMTPFLENRFIQSSTTFSPYNSTAYDLQIGPSSGNYFTTWSQVEQATVAFGNSNTVAPEGPAPGTWALDYGVAATSVVAGLPSSPSQQAAMAWITAHPAATGTNINPAWNIDP